MGNHGRGDIQEPMAPSPTLSREFSQVQRGHPEEGLNTFTLSQKPDCMDLSLGSATHAS